MTTELQRVPLSDWIEDLDAPRLLAGPFDEDYAMELRQGVAEFTERREALFRSATHIKTSPKRRGLRFDEKYAAEIRAEADAFRARCLAFLQDTSGTDE